MLKFAPAEGTDAEFDALVEQERLKRRAQHPYPPNYTPPSETPLYSWYEEIMAKPTWRDRPESANMCDTLRRQKKYAGICFLPSEAFEPSEAERQRAEKESAEYDKRWRNERAKERYRRDMDATRKKWRETAAANRADPVKGPKIRAYNLKWRKTEKGKAADERHRDRRNKQKRDRYANDAEYREARKKQARDAYREKYRNNPEFREAQQTRARNRKRKRKEKPE